VNEFMERVDIEKIIKEDCKINESKCGKRVRLMCNCGIIKYSSRIKFTWDCLIILLVLYNTFAVPFEAAFYDVLTILSNNVDDIFL
jgi:hypothetical protein